MTKLNDYLTKLENLSKEATAEPWIQDTPGCVGKVYPEGGARTIAIAGGFSASREDQANCDLIAESRNAIPVLCAMIRELSKQTVNTEILDSFLKIGTMQDKKKEV